MAHIFALPPEILTKVVQASRKEDLLALRFSHSKLYQAANRRFVVEFFTYRKHEISFKSLKALCAISKHEWTADDGTRWGFCHQLQKITFVSSVEKFMMVHEPRLLQTAFENIARLGHSISLGVCRSNLKENSEEVRDDPGFALAYIASAVIQSRLDMNALSIELGFLKHTWESASLFDRAVLNLVYVPGDDGKPTLKQDLDIDAVWKRGEVDDIRAHYKHRNRSLTVKRSDFSTITAIFRRIFDMSSFGFLPAAISTTPLEILRLEEVTCEHEVLVDLLNTFSTTLKVVQFDKMIVYDPNFQWDRVLETLAAFDLEGLILEEISYWLGSGFMGMSDRVAWQGKDLIRTGLQSMIEDFQEEPEHSWDSEDEKESGESEDVGDVDSSNDEVSEGHGEEDVELEDVEDVDSSNHE